MKIISPLIVYYPPSTLPPIDSTLEDRGEEMLRAVREELNSERKEIGPHNLGQKRKAWYKKIASMIAIFKEKRKTGPLYLSQMI